MKRNKKWLACITAGLFLLNATSAFAADGDVWEVATKQKYADRLTMKKSVVKRLEVRKFPSKYYFEADGKLYTMAVANNAFKTDQKRFLQILKEQVPAEKVPNEPNVSEDLEVIGIE